MFETKTISKARADYLIKLLPFFGDPFWEGVDNYSRRILQQDTMFYWGMRPPFPAAYQIKEQLFFHGREKKHIPMITIRTKHRYVVKP